MNALETHEFIINSHRGVFRSGMLENSIPAYVEALKQGANVLECDIRRTKDDHVVLIHNKTIDGIAKHAISVPDPSEFNEAPTGSVREHTIAFLKAIKYNEDAEILTLDEFLGFLKEHQVGAQIELKESGFENVLIDKIRTAAIDHDGLKAPIVFTSFFWPSIVKFQKLLWKSELPKFDFFNNKKGVCAGLQALPIGSFLGPWLLRQCRKKYIWGFMTYYKYIPASRISYAHECGVKFCPRVPDDETLVLSYINASVDGFETDNVPFIKECIQKAGYSFP
ncbi:MAG TPA: glycerophosphodiester phosphodiesterase family protein [Candidatus Lokiarchaeia archaeon]|nr:glycerophosphodiester phosphodiesterase family protein [Candidatus Lokiarchaeia archaeon]